VQLKFPLRQSLDNKIYSIIQSLPATTITSSNLANVYGAYSYTISTLDQITAFQNLFDQYRIRMIEVEFLPGVNDNNTAASNMGLFATVIDYDDASVLTSFNQALDYTNCLVGTGYESQRRVFKPHVAEALYSGTFTSYGNLESPWVDMVSSTVQHYGVKTVWTPTTTNAQVITMLPKLWIEFRNVR